MRPIDILMDSPVIAAVKDDKGLDHALRSECRIIFIVYGNICNISEMVRKVKSCGKMAIVHADLVHGFSAREIAIDFIHENTRADGVISTKPQLIKRARELGMIGILRAFFIDSMSMESAKKQISSYHPDMCEIMPGLMPSVITKMRAYTDIPLIASGLITDKKDILQAFDAGADAISTTKEDLWYV